MCSMASASEPSSSEPQSSATTSATPPTFYEAAHAVLNTNELLCEIIGRLPLEDIVITTGVCKTWRAALKASVAIQQALFLAPIDIRRITTDTEAFPKRVQDIPLEDYVVVGEVNPFLARICGPVLLNCNYRDAVYPSSLRTLSPKESFEHPVGLWRDVLITQPPTYHACICLYLNRPRFTMLEATQIFVPEREGMYPLQCDQGIRMGQLYDLVESKAQGIQEPVATRVVMPNFNPTHDPFGYWEVRKGKVVREILPPLCYVSS